MAFPSSPVNGQIAVVSGIDYQYNSTLGTWSRLVQGGVTTGTFNTIAANAITVNGVSVVSTSSGAGNLVISNGAINLVSMGPGATTTGSATTIPVITTDAYGRISAITTAAPSLTLNLAGTTGTGSVSANGGTLTFAGSNGVTASASGSTITLNTPQNLQTTATPTFANLTVSGSASIYGFDIRQGNANNLKLSAAATGAVGISGYDSGGNWKYQIYGDGSNYGFLNGNWAGWDLEKVINGQLYVTISGTQYIVLNASNYNTYSPTLTGGGASGTWGISITGSAGSASNATTVAGLAVATGTNNVANQVVRTDANGYIQAGYLNSGNGNEGNNSSPPRVWGTNGSDSYLRTYLTSALNVNSATQATYVYRTAVDTAPVAIINSDGTYYGQISRTGTQQWCLGYGGGVGAATTSVVTWGTTFAQVNGALYSTSSITAYYSDERLKTKIGKIENALDKVDQLSGFLYVENDLAKSLGFNNDQTQVALSAQAVQRVQPEAIALAPFDRDGEGNSISGENYLTVQYERLVPLLVEAIKELRAEVNSIKDQLRG